MKEFSVSIQEGTTSDDIATYFCEERPTLVSLEVEGGKPEQIALVVFVRFIPRNGSPMRVGRETLVPLDKVVVLQGDFKDGLDNRPRDC